MAAAVAASALLCQLLLATGLAAALAGVFGLRVIPAAAVALIVFYCIALSLAAAPFVLAPRSKAAGGAGGAARRTQARQLLGSLLLEALVLDLTWAGMAIEPIRGSPRRWPRDAVVRARPVILVHGFSCNRAVWRPLIQRLAAAGFGPLRAVSLGPMFASVETFASALIAELEAMVDLCGDPGAVTVVTHSMGGLVARAALRHASPGLIGRIITLGAPHHGTAVACRFRWQNAREMCPGSRWLEDLNATQEGQLPVAVTTLYSLEDNFILPATSSRLQGARAIELRGIGHLSLLRSRRVFDCVVSELLAPVPRPSASVPEAP